MTNPRSKARIEARIQERVAYCVEFELADPRSTFITITRVEMSSPELPEQFDGMTVALLSDIHAGAVRSATFTRQAVNLVNAAEPDLVVIAGDLVDGRSERYAPEIAPLADLRAPTGWLLPIVWVGIGLSVFQQFVGINVIFYYSTALWHSVGFTERDSMRISSITGVINIVTTLIAIAFVDRFGRKPVYAAGAILFETVSGRRPFDGKSTFDVLQATLHEQPPALSGSPAAQALDRIVRRALSKRADERHSDVAELRDDLRAVLSEPSQGLVEVVHGEHHAQVAQGVHRGGPVILGHRRLEKARELDPAVAVRRTHHRDLDALVAQSGDAPCPVSFDHGSPFELEAQLGEKRDRGIERFHHDADVVHPLKRHAAILVPPVASVLARDASPHRPLGLAST